MALNEEERATATALVAPYRSEGAFAGRPATRAEIATELHVSERTAQRRLDALAAQARDRRRRRPRPPAPDRRPGDRAGPRPAALTVAGASRVPLACATAGEAWRGAPGSPPERPVARSGPELARSGAALSFAGAGRGAGSVGIAKPTERNVMNHRTLIAALLALVCLAAPAAAGARGSAGAVVFSKSTSDGEVSKGGLFAVKDGHVNQLTENPGDVEPAFAPDGRTIVFARDGDIFSIRPDGSGERRLSSGPEIDSSPLVSPNRRLVVFERRPALSGGTPPLHGADRRRQRPRPDQRRRRRHRRPPSRPTAHPRLRPHPRPGAAAASTTTSTRSVPTAPTWRR